MISVLWVAIVWTPVLYFYVWREESRELKRLYLALALSLMAAYAIADGDVSSITANPVVAERVLRGLLSGSALLLAAGPLSRNLAAVARLRSPNLIALAFYVSVAVLSTLYSVAIPATAGKAFQLGVGFVCTLALATRSNPRAVLKRALEMVVLLGGALVIGAVIGFFVLPSVFQFPESRPGILIRQTMGAPYSHPNGLSVYGATLAGFALARALKQPKGGRLLWIAAAVGGTLGTLFASGRQGLAVLVVSVALVILALRPWAFLLVFLPGAIAVAIAFGESILGAASRGQSTEMLMSLSGRTVWWASAVNAWLEQPLTGFGFGVGGRFVALERIGEGHVSSVHSGILEVLLGVGIIGLIPLLYVLFRVLRFTLEAFRIETEYIVVVVEIGVTTIISLGIGGADLTLFYLIAALADRWLERPRSARRSPALMGKPA